MWLAKNNCNYYCAPGKKKKLNSYTTLVCLWLSSKKVELTPASKYFYLYGGNWSLFFLSRCELVLPIQTQSVHLVCIWYIVQTMRIVIIQGKQINQLHLLMPYSWCDIRSCMFLIWNIMKQVNNSQTQKFFHLFCAQHWIILWRYVD